MTGTEAALVIALAFVSAALIVTLVLAHIERKAADERKFAEQRELITRIAHPKAIPVARPSVPQPAPVRDEYTKVGAVALDRPNGGG